MQEPNKRTFLPGTKVHPSQHDTKKDTDLPSFIGTRIHLQCPVLVNGEEYIGHVQKTYYGWEGYTDRLCPTQRFAGLEYGLDGNSRPKIEPCTALSQQFDWFEKKEPQLPKPTGSKKDDK